MLSAGLCACGGGRDASGWQTAFDAGATGWLLDVWGPAGDDLYAVGGAPDLGVVMHHDGAQWHPIDLGVDPPLLNWAYGFGPDDVTIVGTHGVVLHFDGARWTPERAPTLQNLWGVWGAAPGELWAVGGDGRAAGDATILRREAGEWRVVEVPALERAGVNAFFKVWGAGRDDVWVVGQRGAVLHWDGRALREEPVDAGEDLISVWGTGPDRVAMVGGRAEGRIVTWDGVHLRQRSLAPLPGLNGVWLRPAGRTVHVAGVRGTLASVDWDTLAVDVQRQDTVLDFHAVFGDAGGVLTAVGGNFGALATGPYEGIAMRRPLGAD
jgi:hypothetical protein